MEREPIEEVTTEPLWKIWRRRAQDLEREKVELERRDKAYDKANKDFQELLIIANKDRASLEAKLKVAEALCRKFVLKVETGRAISRETYAECKAFLEVLKG